MNVSLRSLLHWVPQFLEFRQNRLRSQIRLLSLAALVGVVAGLGAIVFYVSTQVVEHYALGSLAGYHAVRADGEFLPSWLPAIDPPLHPWLLLVIPTVGGLLSGLIVYTFAPEAEGHGTDAAIAAYHLRQGEIRPLQPDDQLDRALELFVENDLLALPIVNDLEEMKVIGIARRFDIASAYLKHVHGRPDAVKL